MKYINYKFLFILSVIFGNGQILAADINGLWAQIDEKDNRLNSVVRIETNNNILQGVIVKGFPKPGKTLNTDALCNLCPGEFKDKPLLGLRLLWGLTGSGNIWDGGQILDPDNGEIYRAKLMLSEDGTSLNVRGYVGIELFGRTQIWQRYSDKLE
ncbi:DUF2147 domain-containing protein [Methylomonas sp. AM2-LC]|uniref:DUF2147 domain-containing protein n=1 Tax=Methylomonas sp. AM2-LC TaxID=3153301 RepID=UPI0032656AC4